MLRLFRILFFVVISVGAASSESRAQEETKAPAGWKKFSACQFHFLAPSNLKNQNARGIDSCVAEYKSSKLRIAIDYGWYGGSYRNDSGAIDFKEEIIEIDGRKAQLVTFKNARGKQAYVAGLYVLIHQSQDGTKVSLNMTINAKTAEDSETAKQIFRSLRFDGYQPFTVEP